jgi:lipopolysaccharide/colanic/teichoic acid biosynthesis glycosyltransferase
LKVQTAEHNQLDGMPLLPHGPFPHAHESPLEHPPTDWCNSAGKRLFDLVVAGVGLVVLAPVLLSAAVAIEVTSEGDALFRQERVGRRQEPFTIYKFRTMCDGAEFCGPSVTNRDDPRMTRLGRWLRRFKIDELPQLYNVLRGDMSLVGPRPKLKSHECMQMLVRPGITGAATLLFNREEELLAQVPPELIERYTVQVLNPVKARLDMRYAQHGSFVSDLQLLVATVFRIGWDKDLANLADMVEANPDTSS